MHVILFRNGNRALILPAGKSLFDCSPAQRHWLGTPVSESVAELMLGTPRPGIHSSTVLAEIRAKGVCGLDVYGVVRVFPPVPADPGSGASVTDLLPAGGGSPGNPRG